MIYYMINRITKKPVLDKIKRVMIFPRREALLRYLEINELDYYNFRIVEAERMEDLPK